jgi:uncharacterized membrane protein
MAQYLEVAMILAFGASWPMNVHKSWKSRSTQGKSLAFLVLIFTGYLCGIAGKLMAEQVNWFVLSFYILNACMVAVDIALYARNYRLDQKRKENPNVP